MPKEYFQNEEFMNLPNDAYINVNKNLILESNLFEDSVKFDDIVIKKINHDSSARQAVQKSINIIRNNLKFGHEKSFQIFLCFHIINKPSEITNRDSKAYFLSLCGIKNYSVEDLKTSENLIELLGRLEVSRNLKNNVMKTFTYIEENYIDFIRYEELFKQINKLDLEIENVVTNEKYIKSFNSIEEFLEYTNFDIELSKNIEMI